MDDSPKNVPPGLSDLENEAQGIGFVMGCEPRTGSLLATLAASKPGGYIVELGTGAGAGTAWLLHGMDRDARLVTVDTNTRYQDVARRHLGRDPRVRFTTMDADAWLDWYEGPLIDLAFVDCRPGKFQRLDDLLALMRPGALYIGDDLLPQPTWPPDHQTRVDTFLQALPDVPRLRATAMAWASGLVVGARI